MNKNDDNENDNQNKEEEEDEGIKELQKKTKNNSNIKNKNMGSIGKLLKRKTKRDINDYNIINSKKIKKIKNNNILLEQEQINGKVLDQGFIYNINNKGEEKHIFIGLQMKYLSDNINHSTILKNITKKEIKENIQNILIGSKLDYNINFDEWHYYIVSY